MKTFFIILFSFFTVYQAQAGIAQVQTAPKAENGGFVASLSTSFSTLPSAGNLIVVYALGGYTGGASSWASNSISDNQGNTYQLAAWQSGGGGGGASAIYYADNIGTPSGTFTVTATPPESQIITLTAVEYAGVAKVNPLDVATTNLNSGANPDTGLTAKSSKVNVLVTAILNIDSSSVITITPSAGYNVRLDEGDSNYNTGQAVDRIFSNSYTYSTSWSVDVGAAWDTCIVVFKGASQPSGRLALD